MATECLRCGADVGGRQLFCDACESTRLNPAAGQERDAAHRDLAVAREEAADLRAQLAIAQQFGRDVAAKLEAALAAPYTSTSTPSASSRRGQ